MTDRQIQKAGDNSQQVQTQVFNNYNIGLDEKRVREIIDEKINQAVADFTMESNVVAKRRMENFKNDFVPRLIRDNLLDALKDPSIQLLIVEAQKSAAATEREEDYSLLSELLIHRVKKSDDRNIRAGVSRAIKIVDEISDEALLGLTVVYLIEYLYPETGNIMEGLSVMDKVFSNVMTGPLPIGGEWLEHLDVLDTIRIKSSLFGSLPGIDQLYLNQFPGYMDVGIDKSSQDFKKALDILVKAELPTDFLCDHDLCEGYVRLAIRDLKIVDDIVLIEQQGKSIEKCQSESPKIVPLSCKQKEAIKRIYALYRNDDNLRTLNIAKFMEKWDEFDNLKEIREWWDTIHISFTITPIGRVLAHANGQRHDCTIPVLY